MTLARPPITSRIPAMESRMTFAPNTASPETIPGLSRALRIFTVEPDFNSSFVNWAYEAATGTARRGFDGNRTRSRVNVPWAARRPSSRDSGRIGALSFRPV